MANAESIRPYSDLVHTAAQNGGPEKYLQDIADSNYALGVAAEKDTERLKCAGAAGAALLLFEGGRWVAGKIKNRRQQKQDALRKKSDDAMASYKEYVAFMEANRVDAKSLREEAPNGKLEDRSKEEDMIENG